MFYINPLLQKTFNPLLIMFQKILLKWWFFSGVARTFPIYKHTGVGRGAKIRKFQQNMLFS